MINQKDQLSDLVYQKPGLVLVLERLGIYPGFQDKTVEDVSADHKLNPDLVTLLLTMQVDHGFKHSTQLSANDIKTIVKYLAISHDYFTKELFPSLSENIAKLARENAQPSIKMVNQFFTEYQNEAIKHFDYENEVAFPYILSLIEKEDKLNVKLQKNYSVETYHENHDNIEEKLDDLKQLLIKYLPCDSNYATRRNIILVLHRLDNDLKAHANIENEILIPLVHSLEIKNKQV